MTPARVVVFLGPSCSGERALAALAAELRPPARRGDVERAARDGATTIILVDGYLVHDYPPSPMEVYGVLARGVRVIGTASLGALRAVELRDHGMIGSGWVYDQFVNGFIDRDDEVVVACDSRDGHALTVPLVNLRFGVKALYKLGRIGHDEAEAALQAAGAIYLEERTAAAVRAAIAPVLAPDLIDELLSPAYDIKARDTTWTLLCEAARDVAAGQEAR